MTELFPVLALIYTAGVGVGLIATDADGAGRLGLALMWPVGPLAFIATLSILFAASLIVFPLFGLAVAAAAALGYSLFSV